MRRGTKAEVARIKREIAALHYAGDATLFAGGKYEMKRRALLAEAYEKLEAAKAALAGKAVA